MIEIKIEKLKNADKKTIISFFSLSLHASPIQRSIDDNKYVLSMIQMKNIKKKKSLLEL